MSTLQERLKEYQSKGAKEMDASFAPTVMITNEEGTENYIEGKLLGRSVVKTSYGASPVYTAELISTDCPVKAKVGKVYVDAEVSVGETVSFFAPKRLDVVLKKCKVGDTVLIGYTGREDKKKAKGRNPAHLHTVLNMGGGTQPIASAADIAADAPSEEEF